MKRVSAAPRAPAPQSVERIFTVLDHLAAERGGDSLAGIARVAGAPKSSMVGLLAGMVDGQYLARDEHGRYTLGPRMLSLAMRVSAATDVTALARPVLERLVEQTGETALVGRLAPDAELAAYVAKVESANPIRYTVPLGERRELHCTAIGKLLLAFMEPARRERYLARPLKGFTPQTITSVRRLRAELEGIARGAVSYTESERVEGASAMAAPVFGPTGDFVLGVVLAGPAERMRAARARNEAKLRDATERITRLVSGAGVGAVR